MAVGYATSTATCAAASRDQDILRPGVPAVQYHNGMRRSSRAGLTRPPRGCAHQTDQDSLPPYDVLDAIIPRTWNDWPG